MEFCCYLVIEYESLIEALGKNYSSYHLINYTYDWSHHILLTTWSKVRTPTFCLKYLHYFNIISFNIDL